MSNNSRFGRGGGPYQPTGHQQPQEKEDVNVEYDLHGLQQTIRNNTNTTGNARNRNNNDPNPRSFGSIGANMMDMMYGSGDNSHNNNNNNSTSITDNISSHRNHSVEDNLRSNTGASDSLFSGEETSQLLTLCSNAGTNFIEKIRSGKGGDNNSLSTNINNEDNAHLAKIAEESWSQVRNWLRNRSPIEVRQAAEQTDDASRTALHFACMNKPPIGIIHELMSAALDTVKWTDNRGRLPLHYASVYMADQEVINVLTDSYHTSKITVDSHGRTPLHLMLGNGNRNIEFPGAHTIVATLSSSGAAKYADYNGMLPLHYACAYGASEEVLYVLTGEYKEGIRAHDRMGRTPLHFALSNAGNEASPTAVQHLLALDPELANINSNEGVLPLRVLADFANRFRPPGNDPTCKSVRLCLEYFLDANPNPTPDFFTALQSLPIWLSEHAVVMPKVQALLNDKISQRFPSAILMLDSMILLLTIIFYFICVQESIIARFKKDPEVPPTIPSSKLIVLILSIGYFSLREMVQMISFISMKAFSIWMYDVTSWLNILFVSLICFWTITMGMGTLDNDLFRTGTALTVFFIWLKLAIFLRQTFQTFAVFCGAMIYILRRLTVFIIASFVFLLAFAQMFRTEKMYTEDFACWCLEPDLKMNTKDGSDSIPTCRCAKNETIIAADNTTTVKCVEMGDPFSYCNVFRAFLHMLTMLLGEVDDAEFPKSFDKIFFILFMVFMVVILATVLIAIVTDSYKIIQTQRSAIVFWTNRLHFVAQVGAISSGFQNERFRKILGIDKARYKEGRFHGTAGMTFGEDFWKRLIDLFEDEVNASVMTTDFWVHNIMRLFTAIVIIPAWFTLGLISLGWLWPPQLRQFFWTAPVTKYAEASEEELRKTQVMLLDKEVKALSEDITHELTIDRIEVLQMKSSIADRRAEIANEMRHIKHIMNMLFDQQAQH